MREHIDTIPVWDAAKKGGECILCTLESRMEQSEAERYLGASVMEPDIRIRVNDRGFCRRHHSMLFGMSNRLGHALMLESHTIETREKMAKISAALKKEGEALKASGLGDRLNGKAKSASGRIVKEAGDIAEMTAGCVMCDTIEENMNRYLHTFFHLYRTDEGFRKLFREGKGVCLPHMAGLLKAAEKELPPRELGEFTVMLAELEEKNLDRIQEDISWFIKKFDYRFEKEDWKNSRDAVERTANKMRGHCIGDTEGGTGA